MRLSDGRPRTCTIGNMTALDVDLVRRWFDRLRRQDLSVIAYWGVRPTAEEFAALDEGGAAIDLAVRDLPPSAPSSRCSGATSSPPPR